MKKGAKPTTQTTSFETFKIIYLWEEAAQMIIKWVYFYFLFMKSFFHLLWFLNYDRIKKKSIDGFLLQIQGSCFEDEKNHKKSKEWELRYIFLVI